MGRRWTDEGNRVIGGRKGEERSEWNLGEERTENVCSEGRS